jgi:hypothetical protein
MRVGAQLPDRCVKTNLPAEGHSAEIRLRWQPPASYLTLLINLVLFYFVTSRTMTVITIRVGLSPRAFRSIRRASVLKWLGLIGGPVLWGAALVAHSSLPFWAGLALMLVAVPPGLTLSRVVWATHVEGDHVWIEGVHPDYLAELPEWPG